MLCLVRSGEQQLTGLASVCNYRRPETSFLDGNRCGSRSTTSMDNGQPLLIDVELYRTVAARRFQTRPNSAKPQIPPCQPVTDRLEKCVTRVPQMQPSQTEQSAVQIAISPCVGDKDTAQAPQVRLEKNWRTMGSDPTPRSTQAHTHKTQGSMPELCSGCLK